MMPCLSRTRSWPMAAGIAPRPPAACRRGGEASPSPRPREDTLRKKAREKKETFPPRT